MKNYIPHPIDTSDIELSPELLELGEKLAENCHEVWAKGRAESGWTFGSTRDDNKKETPCMVPYSELPDSEKEYDRNTCMETLKLIVKLGFKIENANEKNSDFRSSLFVGGKNSKPQNSENIDFSKMSEKEIQKILEKKFDELFSNLDDEENNDSQEG